MCHPKYSDLFVVYAVMLICVAGQRHALAAEDTKADKDRMIQTVKFLSQDCFPRSEKEQYEKAAKYVTDHFKENNLEVSQQSYDNKYNVIGIKKGKTRKRIIIGAHYDTVSITPGADDNASGVAVLIELAYLLKRLPELDCDIELVAWNSEEPPYFATNKMGSYAHADSIKKSVKEDGVEIVALICMDLVGYYSDEENSQDFPLAAMSMLYGKKGDFLAITGRMADAKTAQTVHDVMKKETNLKTAILSVPDANKNVIAFSDHINYWDMECPAVFLTDTAFYRNKNYHMKTDTWDTLDYDKMVELANGLSKSVQVLIDKQVKE
ncbi:MAG: M28 family peptidase [Thermoguttaceae bacterium]